MVYWAKLDPPCATQSAATVQPLVPGGVALLPTCVVGGPLAAGNVLVTLPFTGTGSATSFGPLTGSNTTRAAGFFSIRAWFTCSASRGT